MSKSNKKNTVISDDSKPPFLSRLQGLLDSVFSTGKLVRRPDPFKKIYLGSFFVVAIITLLLSINTEINGDDYFQNSYSDQIIDFYTSFGKDTTCFYHSDGPIQFYGGLFESIASVSNKTLGFNKIDKPYHQVRHVISACFGLICMFFLSIWLRNTGGGWLLATLGLWILFCSPRFLGHSLMNPKDIPFAAGYLIALFFIGILLREFPRIKYRSLVGLSAGIAISIGLRIGGLILLAYILLFFALKAFQIFIKKKSLENKEFFKPILRIGIVSLAGLIIGLVFWPYGIYDPLNHIPEALAGFTKSSESIKILFQGLNFYSSEVPWNYHLSWMIKTIPLSVILGLLVLPFGIRSLKNDFGLQDFLLALFAFAFPLLYIIYKGSLLHDGWRHIIFIYPPLVFLACLGWFFIFKRYWERKVARIGLFLILGLSILESGLFMTRNYNYPYVYFNPLGEGIQGAYGSYELDYWGLSSGTASDWIIKNRLKNESKKVIIATNFVYPVKLKFSKFKNVDVTYVSYNKRHFEYWDYAIFVNRYIPGIQLREGIWPPSSQEVHSVKANGVKLAVVLENKDGGIFQGELEARNKNYVEAIKILELESLKHPDDDLVWVNLGHSYQSIRDYANAERCLNQALRINQHSIYAHNYLSFNYYLQGDVNRSIQSFKDILKFDPQNDIGTYYLTMIFNVQGDLNSALTYGLKTIEIKPRKREAYAQVIDIYKKLGDLKNASKYRSLLTSLEEEVK